jgi:hypothetical protein
MNVPRYVEQQVSRIAAAHSPLDEMTATIPEGFERHQSLRRFTSIHGNLN